MTSDPTNFIKRYNLLQLLLPAIISLLIYNLHYWPIALSLTWVIIVGEIFSIKLKIHMLQVGVRVVVSKCAVGMGKSLIWLVPWNSWKSFTTNCVIKRSLISTSTQPWQVQPLIHFLYKSLPNEIKNTFRAVVLNQVNYDVQFSWGSLYRQVFHEQIAIWRLYQKQIQKFKFLIVVPGKSRKCSFKSFERRMLRFIDSKLVLS